MKEKLIINHNSKNNIEEKLKGDNLTDNDIDIILNGDYYECSESNDYANRISSIFNENYYYIISSLGLGYSYEKMLKDYPNIITKEKISKFEEIIRKHDITKDDVISICRYSTSPSIVKLFKVGRSKEEILDKIYSSLRVKLNKKTNKVFEYLNSIDYSNPLYYNLDNLDEFCENNNIEYDKYYDIRSTLKKLDLFYNLENTTKSLDKLLSIPLPNSLVLYKNVDKNFVNKIQGSDNIIKGNSYISFSFDDDSEKDALFKLYVPKGTEGISISTFSNLYKNEQEVLLNDFEIEIIERKDNYIDKNNNRKVLVRALLLSLDKSNYINMNNDKEVDDSLFLYRNDLNRNLLSFSDDKILSNFYISNNKLKHILQIGEDRKVIIENNFDYDDSVLEKFIIDFSRRIPIVETKINPINDSLCDLTMGNDDVVMSINNIDYEYAKQISVLAPKISSDIYYVKRKQVLNLKNGNNPLLVLSAKNIAGYTSIIIISIISIVIGIIIFVLIFY